VASWAARFLFTGEQLQQPVERLSGGERARVLIARLMLEPADLLLLDEPTNDLDIPTLEILEEALLEYPGALVLVTHDRYMLDRVSNVVLGLDGMGGAGSFADYGQWEEWQRGNRNGRSAAQERGADGKQVMGAASSSANSQASPNPGKKKKLSYNEQREWDTMEDQIAEAETAQEEAQARMESPGIASDAAALQSAIAEAEAAADRIHTLYERWAELGAKVG
jgi:ATP-binding cassette subfamily F protein uup